MTEVRDDKTLFTQAVELRDSGSYDASLKILEELIERRKDSARLFAVAGHVCWKLGKLKVAEDYFQHAVRISPRDNKFSLGLFHTRWKQGKEVEALDEAKRFTALTGSDEYMAIVREINEKNPQP